MQAAKIFLLFAFLCFLIPTSALGQDVVQAQKLFQSGVKAGQAGRYEEAIELFNQAYNLAPARSRPAILFNIAVIEDSKPNNCEGARRALDRFLSECTSTCRDHDLGKNRVDALEERCNVAVSVTSEPPGVSAYLDDTLIGVTPTETNSFPGTYQIRLELDGYETLEEEFKIEDSKPLKLNYTLEKSVPLGRLRLVNIPANLMLSLDDEMIGAEALRGITVPVGEHVLEMRTLNPPRSYATTINVEDDSVTTVDVQARKSIFERAEIPKAAVYTFWSSAAVTAVAAGIGTGFLIARESTVSNIDNTQDPVRRQDLRGDLNGQGNAAAVAFATAGVAAGAALTSWLWPSITQGKEPLYW